MDTGPFDPIVIDPRNTDVSAEWKECADYVDRCGGVTYPGGEVNWRAAFGADPGVCTCPSCHVYHWAFGNRQRCTQCGFEYPVDWWSMYAYGVNAAREDRSKYPMLHLERLSHPYYRYGFEHPVDDAWKEHERIDWKAVLA